MGSEPVAGELLVEGRLTVTRLIAFCRPEAELSGVSISSPITRLPSSSRPNSNFVSAMMIPFARAYSAHFFNKAMVLSRRSSAYSRPFPGKYFSRWSMLCSKEIFSSWSRSQPLWTEYRSAPGVYRISFKPSGRRIPQTVPSFL